MTVKTITAKELKTGDIVKIDTTTKHTRNPNWGQYPDLNFLQGCPTVECVVWMVRKCTRIVAGKPLEYVAVYLQQASTKTSIVGTYLIHVEKDHVIGELVGKITDKQYDQETVVKNMPPKGYGITVGADPEIFLRDAKTKQSIPAFTVLVSKAESTKLGKEEQPYWDGFQAEFNTQPSGCLAFQVDSIARSLKNLLTAAKKTALPRHEVQLSSKTVINLHSSSFKDAKKEHIEFGCMPSRNAYDERLEMADGAVVPFRMAGGHLHFGWSEGSRPSTAECKEMVKSLDTILGVYCVALFHKYDDKRRRALYGRAGEYRKPPHGLEYRVLSNAWLIHPVYAHLVFEIGRRAINMVGMVDLLWQASEEEVRDCINNCDLRLAKKLLMRNAVMMKALLQNITGYEEGAERLFKLAFDGADSVLDTKRTLEDRWNINGTWVSHSDGKGKNITTALPMLLENQMLG